MHTHLIVCFSRCPCTAHRFYTYQMHSILMINIVRTHTYFLICQLLWIKVSAKLENVYGLFIICYSGSSEELTVNQSPSNITVNEGDSAQISCCWKTKHENSVKVAWYINEIRLGVKDQTQNCSTLHLTNILKNQTGHYVCEVIHDIPVLLKVKGNGTDLSVGVRQLQNTTTGKILPSQSNLFYTLQYS